MTNSQTNLKFTYKNQSLFLIITDWAKLDLLTKIDELKNISIIYKCSIVDFIFTWIHTRVNNISLVEIDSKIDDKLFTYDKFELKIDDTEIGSFYCDCNSVLGEFEYRLNRKNYIKLPVAFSTIDSEKQLTPDEKLATTTAAKFNNFILPFKLIHGTLSLTIDEIASLEVGDIIFFDYTFAPNQVLFFSPQGGILCDLENSDTKLRVKEVLILD